jgi:hypothetical protein
MTSTYLLTPYATLQEAAAGAAPLPRVPVTGGVLDVLAQVRPWFDARAAAVVHVHRDGALVARLTAAALTASDGITFTLPGHADPGPHPAVNLAQAVLLAGASLTAGPDEARASMHRAGVWLMSVDAADFPGLADPADDDTAPAPWPAWTTWCGEPPAAYVTAVADSLADGFGWTIAETSPTGFSVDFSPKAPEPHHTWTDHQTNEYWWATFTPQGWECGMKSAQQHYPRGRARREIPVPVPADPGHPGDVAVYLNLALEHGAAYLTGNGTSG